MSLKIIDDHIPVLLANFSPFELDEPALVNKQFKMTAWQVIKEYQIPGLTEQNFVSALKAIKKSTAYHVLDDYIITLVGTRVINLAPCGNRSYPYFWNFGNDWLIMGVPRSPIAYSDCGPTCLGFRVEERSNPINIRYYCLQREKYQFNPKKKNLDANNYIFSLTHQTFRIGGSNYEGLYPSRETQSITPADKQFFTEIFEGTNATFQLLQAQGMPT